MLKQGAKALKIVRNIVMIILLIVIIAVISYQLLNISLPNQEEQNLDPRLKSKLETKQDLSDLIVEESNQLKMEERDSKPDFEMLSKDHFKLQRTKVDDSDLFELEKPEQSFDKQINGDDSSEQESKSEEEIKVEVDSGKKEFDVKSAENLFLGIKDGYVAIYKGDILEESELVEVRKDIPLKSLAEEDIKKLQLGIEIENKTELFSILEGFLSAKN
jgi:hypothetical protein